jgi:hypothetical protein
MRMNDNTALRRPASVNQLRSAMDTINVGIQA